jgi:hypothetical protein
MILLIIYGNEGVELFVKNEDMEKMNISFVICEAVK